MSEKHTPCIIVPGIGQSMIELLDNNGHKIKMAWQLDIDGDKFVRELKFPLIRSVILRHDLGLSKKMSALVDEAVDPIATKPDGTMKNNIRVVDYPQSVAECSEEDRKYIYRMVPMQKLGQLIGEENLYFFSYNSFGEPYKTASDLNDFIQKIKKERNCDKVNIVPVSMGGAMSVAYFDAYGHQNDIKRVMYFVAALQGTPVISDLMDMNINTGRAVSFIRFIASRQAAEGIEKIQKILPDKVFDSLIKSAVDSVRKKVVLHCPSLWSTIPPETYDYLSKKYLSDKSLSVLKEKADRFYKAQKAFPETFLKLQEQGVEFFAVTGYNLQLMPIVNSDKASSDAMINIESASLGATASPLGEKLKNVDSDSDYISPDGTIDASTSLMPDRVWYFKDQQHDNTAYNQTALEVAARVLSDDSFNSVYSSADLPRFGIKADKK